MLVYDIQSNGLYDHNQQMSKLPKLDKLATCCMLIFALALTSILGYIITQQALDIGSKVNQADQLQSASVAVLACQQVCRNDYVAYSIEQGDSCCSVELVSSCMFKTLCRDDVVQRQRLEIRSMLSNLYFQCGFLLLIAAAFAVFMCFKCKKRRQQSRMITHNNGMQGRIQSILDGINHKNEPLLGGTKEQLNPSYLGEHVEQTCPICLQQVVNTRVIKLNCGHVFHSGCIEEWIVHNARCAVCRSRL